MINKSYLINYTLLLLLTLIFILYPGISYSARQCNSHIGKPNDCWDFRISNISLMRDDTTNVPTIKVKVKNVETADRTGRIKVSFFVKHRITGNPTVKTYEVNIAPQGEEGDIEYKPPLNYIGTYDVDISVTGGWGYLWSFDTQTLTYTVTKGNSSIEEVHCAECMNNCLSEANRSELPSIWRPFCRNLCKSCK